MARVRSVPVISFPRPRGLRGAAALAATLALVAGCGSTGDDSTTPADSSGSGDSASADTNRGDTNLGDTVTIAVPPTELTLLEPGSEPRITLGGPLPDDAAGDVSVFSSADIFQTIDDEPEQDFSTPAVTFEVSATVGDAGTIDMQLHNPSSPDPGLAGVVGSAEGAQVSVTVDNRRAISELRITPTAESSDTVRGTVEQAIYQLVYRTVVVPEAPVGVGAQWQFTQNVDSGLILNQTTTATLREITDGAAVIDLVIEQRPTSDTWTLPDDAGSLRVERYTTSGAGSITLDAQEPLPSAGSISLQGEQVYADPNSSTSLSQRTNNVLRYGD